MMTDAAKLAALDAIFRNVTRSFDDRIDARLALNSEVGRLYLAGALAPRAELDEAVGLLRGLTDRLEHANGFITARTGARNAARTEALNEARAFLARQEAEHE